MPLLIATTRVSVAQVTGAPKDIEKPACEFPLGYQSRTAKLKLPPVAPFARIPKTLRLATTLSMVPSSVTLGAIVIPAPDVPVPLSNTVVRVTTNEAVVLG